MPSLPSRSANFLDLRFDRIDKIGGIPANARKGTANARRRSCSRCLSPSGVARQRAWETAFWARCERISPKCSKIARDAKIAPRNGRNRRFPRTEMPPEARGRGREPPQSYRSRPRAFATPGNAWKRAQGARRRARTISNGLEPSRVSGGANGSSAGDNSSWCAEGGGVLSRLACRR